MLDDGLVGRYFSHLPTPDLSFQVTALFTWRKPSPERLRRFIAEQTGLDFTYPSVGATNGEPPGGYLLDHTRAHLGEGEAIFAAGRHALENWDQFDLGWIEAWPRDTPLRAGQVVAVVAHVFGQWTSNAARIVYVVDEAGPITRFGFAYGTLPGHVEAGEERFLVEWDRADDSVWYDLLAFSRPRHVLARLGSPIVRRWQRRFARESVASMQRSIRARG